MFNGAKAESCKHLDSTLLTEQLVCMGIYIILAGRTSSVLELAAYSYYNVEKFVYSNY